MHAGAAHADAGAMEVLHQTVLRHVLETEDDVLGPWLLGRDTAEDELHAFAGKRRAVRVLLRAGGLSTHTESGGD